MNSYPIQLNFIFAEIHFLFLKKSISNVKIIADSMGSVCEGKYSIMNPPSIGVMIWATLVSELLTPSIDPVSFCVTLFVSLLVKRGLLTPVP